MFGLCEECYLSPSCLKNAVSSAGARISKGFVAKLAILIGVLYFCRKIRFCIILPSNIALFCPVLCSIDEKEKVMWTFFSVASLQSTWFIPDSL